MRKRAVIISISLCMFILLGCTQDLNNPRMLAEKSEQLYRKAIQEYQELLKGDKDNKQIRLQLGGLYYNHGNYSEAISLLYGIEDQQAQKLTAYSFYNSAQYTQALAIFERLGRLPDPEYLFYYGKTSEKQNLFEDAVELFKLIDDKVYAPQARERIRAIEGLRQGTFIDLEALPEDLQAVIKEEIKNKANIENYPLAGAVILLAQEETELKEDDTLVTDAHFIVKILNERGKRDFSEVKITYDSTYEKVDLEYAKTIKPDNQVVVVGSKDIRDVSRYLNFPLYSNARVRIISMPEVTIGSIIEYKVRITDSQLLAKDDFNLAYTLKEKEPILYAKFNVTLPKNRELKIKVLNQEYNPQGFNLKPDIREGNGKKVYSWEFKDIPQIELQPSMPPEGEITPVILLSTFDSWDEVYKWWWPLAKDRLASDAAIEDEVKELIRGKESREDKIRAVYNYCVQDIRYVGAEYGQAGYRPHKAEDIFKNKYGDCKDKAILFISMLKAAGIDGYPVLIGTRGTPMMQEDFPAVIFNHCIAAVELDNKMVFLDITAEVCSFGDLPEDDQDRRVLVFKDDAYQIGQIPLLEPLKNKVEYKTIIDLSVDEAIAAKREVRTFGKFDQGQRYLLRYTPENLVEENLKRRIQEMAVSGRLLKYNYENRDDLNKPIQLLYEYEGKSFLSRAGKARVLPQFSRLDTSIVAKDSRLYPLELGLPSVIEDEIRIQLPDNLGVKYLPEDVNIGSDWLDYFISYKLDGTVLKISQRQVVEKRQVSKEEYPEFKKYLEALAIKVNQYVILEEKGSSLPSL